MTGSDTDIARQLGEAEMGRRGLLARGAVLAGAWTAPTVLAVPAARAQVGTPRPSTCTTTAYDVLVTFAGPASGVVGPGRACANTGGGSVATLAVTVPGTPTPIAQFSALTATCGASPCQAHAQVTQLSVLLAAIGIPATIEASALESQASCSGGVTTLSSSVGHLSVNGTAVDASAPPNTTVFDQSFGLGSVRIVVNEQSGNTVKALHITADMLDQSVDIVVASSSANC